MDVPVHRAVKVWMDAITSLCQMTNHAFVAHALGEVRIPGPRYYG